MGDLNTKVGNSNTEPDSAEFCTMHDLVIGGTLFQHKDIHKLT